MALAPNLRRGFVTWWFRRFVYGYFRGQCSSRSDEIVVALVAVSSGDLRSPAKRPSNIVHAGINKSPLNMIRAGFSKRHLTIVDVGLNRHPWPLSMEGSITLF
jgi:hypothetical protein